MIPIKKEWLAGGLVLISAGVWIPQFLDSGADEAPRRIPGFQEGIDLPRDRGVPPSPGIESESDGDWENSGTETPESDDSSDASLPESGPNTGGDRDLASLLQSLASQTEEAPPSDDPLGPEAPGQSDLEALQAFSEEHPLQGAILGPDSSAALLGHRIVHVGDLLAEGRGRLKEIGPGWVTLERGDSTLRIDLPPFVARVSTSPDPSLFSDSEGQDQEGTDSDFPPAIGDETQDDEQGWIQ